MDTPDVAFYQSPWFQAALIVLAAIVAARIVNAVLVRRETAVRSLLGKQLNEAARTRYVMLRRLAQTTIVFVGAALALAQFQTVQLVASAMLTSVAIVAAIVGIAARAPLANLVSGVMIAFSQPVRLGDYISINDVYGTVEEITLTHTYVRTLDDHRVVIPNELFASTPYVFDDVGQQDVLRALQWVGLDAHQPQERRDDPADALTQRFLVLFPIQVRGIEKVEYVDRLTGL